MPRKTNKRSPALTGQYYEENGLFCWRIRIGGRANRRATVIKTKTAEERRKRVNAKLQELEGKGFILSGTEPTIKQKLTQWLEHRIKPNRSPNTYDSHESNCRLYIFPMIGSVRASKLTAPHIQRLVSSMQEKNLSGSSIHGAVTTLCAGIGKSSRLLLGDVELPAKSDPRSRIIPQAEMGMVIQECCRTRELKTRSGTFERAHRYGNLIIALLCTAVRISEGLGVLIVDLTLTAEPSVHIWKQLHWHKRKTKTARAKWNLRDTKSKKGKRSVPLIPIVLPAIRDQLALLDEDRARARKGYEDNGFLFASESGLPLQPRNIQRALDDILDDLKMPHYSLQDLRRSFLTHYARVEERPQILMAIAGHSNIQTTMKHYVWAEEETKRESMGRVTFGIDFAQAVEPAEEQEA